MVVVVVVVVVVHRKKSRGGGGGGGGCAPRRQRVLTSHFLPAGSRDPKVRVIFWLEKVVVVVVPTLTFTRCVCPSRGASASNWRMPDTSEVRLPGVCPDKEHPVRSHLPVVSAVSAPKANKRVHCVDGEEHRLLTKGQHTACSLSKPEAVKPTTPPAKRRHHKEYALCNLTMSTCHRHCARVAPVSSFGILLGKRVVVVVVVGPLLSRNVPLQSLVRNTTAQHDGTARRARVTSEAVALPRCPALAGAASRSEDTNQLPLPEPAGVCHFGQFRIRPALVVAWVNCFSGQCHLGQAQVLKCQFGQSSTGLSVTQPNQYPDKGHETKTHRAQTESAHWAASSIDHTNCERGVVGQSA